MRMTGRTEHAAATALQRVVRWTFGVTLSCGILLVLGGIGLVSAPVSLLTRNLNLTPAVTAVYGSVGQGRADLQGGYRLVWTTRTELFALPHLATDFVLEGPGTRVTGTVRSGVREIALQGAAGRAGPGLTQLVPGAWECSMAARVTDVSFLWGWRRVAASGDIQTPEGLCRKAGREITVPPLSLVLSGAGREALIVLSSAQTPLATLTVRRERRLGIAIAPAAADIFEQLPRGGPLTLELPF
jgi:hypothetical protein